MDEAIKRRSAEWSVSNTGLTGYIEGYNDCLQDHSDGYEVKTITHPLFGPDPVKVFAIKCDRNWMLRGENEK